MHACKTSEPYYILHNYKGLDRVLGLMHANINEATGSKGKANYTQDDSFNSRRAVLHSHTVYIYTHALDALHSSIKPSLGST